MNIVMLNIYIAILKNHMFMYNSFEVYLPKSISFYFIFYLVFVGGGGGGGVCQTQPTLYSIYQQI